MIILEYPPPKADHCFKRSMHQNIADCLLSSQSINQSASQPKQPRRLSVSFFVKANTCYIKAVACPRGGAGWGSNSHFFFIRMVRPSTRMVTVIFQGIRTRIAEKPYIFVIFWGRGGVCIRGCSVAANLLASVHFYCCSHCSRGSAFVPCLILLFLVDERGHLAEKNQLQTTFICQVRRTVLCPLARHNYPCFSTGSTQ